MRLVDLTRYITRRRYETAPYIKPRAELTLTTVQHDEENNFDFHCAVFHPPRER